MIAWLYLVVVFFLYPYQIRKYDGSIKLQYDITLYTVMLAPKPRNIDKFCCTRYIVSNDTNSTNHVISSASSDTQGWSIT